MIHFIKNLSRFEIIAIGAILLLLVIRFAITPFSPPGFFLDEAATGAHVTAMLQHSTNAHGQPWPLFSASLGGGYTTPVYLYPLVAWAAIFSANELSLRYFSVFVTCLAIILLALGMRYWLKRKAFYITTFSALAMPWGWIQGSLAWDPAIVPLFVAAGFLCFSAGLLSSNKKIQLAGIIGLPTALVALAYAYPPCRITAPLLFALFYGVLYFKKRISLKVVAGCSVLAAVIALPLAIFMLQPDALERSKALSIFYEVSFFEAIGRLLLNLTLLLNPIFLFFFGDPNIRHATGFQGMLGLAALPAIAALLYHLFQKRTSKFTPLTNNTHLLLLISVLGVAFGVLGSALTNEGQPHSLRATATWPFMTILVSIGWYILVTYYKKRVVYRAYIFFAICTLFYISDLAIIYPPRAADAFDVPVREKIYNGEVVDYPGLSIRYYETK